MQYIQYVQYTQYIQYIQYMQQFWREEKEKNKKKLMCINYTKMYREPDESGPQPDILLCHNPYKYYSPIYGDLFPSCFSD